jgi:hypothetical protein
MFTIDASRMTISWANAITARASQRLGSSLAMPVWVRGTSAVAVGAGMFSGATGGMPAPAEATGSGPALLVPESGGRELLTESPDSGAPETSASV